LFHLSTIASQPGAQMKFHQLTQLFFLPLMLNVTAVSAASESESGIKATLEAYFKGHATGDAKYFRAAFLPTAHIEGNREGKFVSWTLDTYCESYKGIPAPDEATRKRSIESIDISGDSAMAKATLVHGAVTFTDYFVLLRVEGNWKIANKVYFAKR
jgi:Putative lumazine-binding